MRSRPEDSVWARSDPAVGTPRPDLALARLTDEQLLAERERRRAGLEQLVRHPGTSPAVGRLLVDADRDIQRTTDELLRRALVRFERSTSTALPHPGPG